QEGPREDAGRAVARERASTQPSGRSAIGAPAARCRKFRRGSFILNLPLPSHHSITSSARASTDEGRSRPRALAVFRLIAGFYLVGACTGRAAPLSAFTNPSHLPP